MFKKMLVMLAFSLSSTIFSMNYDNQSIDDLVHQIQNPNEIPGNIEFSTRSRLFAIDDEAVSNNASIKKIVYKNGAAIIIAAHQNAPATAQSHVIPAHPESTFIISEDKHHLLVAEPIVYNGSQKQIIKIYRLASGYEIFQYDGNFSDIRDMKLINNEIDDDLTFTVTGHDVDTHEPKHTTHIISPSHMSHIRIWMHKI